MIIFAIGGVHGAIIGSCSELGPGWFELRSWTHDGGHINFSGGATETFNTDQMYRSTNNDPMVLTQPALTAHTRVYVATELWIRADGGGWDGEGDGSSNPSGLVDCVEIRSVTPNTGTTVLLETSFAGAGAGKVQCYPFGNCGCPLAQQSSGTTGSVATSGSSQLYEMAFEFDHDEDRYVNRWRGEGRDKFLCFWYSRPLFLFTCVVLFPIVDVVLFSCGQLGDVLGSRHE